MDTKRDDEKRKEKRKERDEKEEKREERPKRETRKPERLLFSASSSSSPLVVSHPPPSADFPIPKTLKEARDGPFWEGFKEAIGQELRSLEENATWDVITKRDLPRGANVLNCKFVFDIKRGASGQFLKFKPGW